MSSTIKPWKIAFLIFLIIGTIYILKNNSVTYKSNSGKIFGTYYNIIYKHKNDLKQDIVNVLNSVDNSLSPFNKNSIITAINENRDIVPDSMFLRVFSMAQHISNETEGAFDITVAPLVNAWGFGFKKGIPADSATIDSLRRYVGYTTVAYENGKIVKNDPQTMLDCSAIAKGYACDEVARMLRNKGISDFMVEIGGEVVTEGKNEKGNKWAIGISTPEEGASHNDIQEIIHISGKSMATSGNYRNYRYEGERRVAHTIDPRTGYPVQHSLLSATVVADNCTTADALATAFMVMGIEEAIEYSNSHPEIDVYLIYSDSTGNFATCETEGMKRLHRNH